MAGTVEEIMTRDPRAVDVDATAADAARAMRDDDIGDVIVTEGGRVAGIVTDRDIVVRAIAEGRDPQSIAVRDICSSDLRTLEPGEIVDEAVRAMREHCVRRLPVVSDGELVGVLSLGDLAQERDPESALADISAASPTQ